MFFHLTKLQPSCCLESIIVGFRLTLLRVHFPSKGSLQVTSVHVNVEKVKKYLLLFYVSESMENGPRLMLVN